MDTKSGEFSRAASRWEQQARRLWESVPETRRKELERALELLPPNLRGWRRLIGHAAEHLRVTAGAKQQVVIVGPANVGKSTLYNQLIRPPAERASVSAVAGTTRQAQEADAGLFAVVDTPGADAVGAVGEAERDKALAAARQGDVLVALFDAASGIGTAERRLYEDLQAMGKPMVVGLNKMDLVGREAPAVLGQAANALGMQSDHVVPLSAKDGRGVERVLLAVARTEPGIVGALGAALPEYRWKIAQTVIGRAGSTAAAIAVTPWPFLSFFPLITVQSAMVLSIARIYQYRINIGRVRELVATFGLGLLGRAVFYELAKFGGPPGWVVAAGVAAGTTVAMGYAAAVWFDRSERLSNAAVARISRAVGVSIVERLRYLGRKPPERVTLRQRVQEALKNLPAPDEGSFRGSDRASAPETSGNG